MKTIIWISAIFALCAFLFSATVNAANALAENLLDSQENKISVNELMYK